MCTRKFPYNKLNKRKKVEMLRVWIIEKSLERMTVSELISLSVVGGRYSSYIPDVAFRKLPPLLSEAVSRPDIEKRLFFTHSDPFFSSGALLQSCCCVSSNLHRSEFIAMFLEEFKSIQSLELNRRLPRLIIGFLSKRATYGDLPDYWELDEKDLSPEESRGRASDVRRGFDDPTPDYEDQIAVYQINLLKWYRFPIEWDLFNSPQQWKTRKKEETVKTMVWCLMDCAEDVDDRMIHILAASLVAARYTHSSIGQRCCCSDCKSMVGTYAFAHEHYSYGYSGKTYKTARRLRGGLRTSNSVGYWSKEVYFRLFPLLNVYPDCKRTLEIMYENGSIDMASFMDNLFMDDLFISLRGRPLLMRDYLFALLKEGDGTDSNMYERAALNILQFTLNQAQRLPKDYYSALLSIRDRIPINHTPFFGIILKLTEEFGNRVNKYTKTSLTDVKRFSNRFAWKQPWIMRAKRIRRIRKTRLSKVSPIVEAEEYVAMVAELIAASLQEDVEERLLFTRNDPFYMAGKRLNESYPNVETIDYFIDRLVEAKNVVLESRTARIFIGMLVDLTLWTNFKADWKVFSDLPKKPKLEYSQHGDLRGNMKKAAQMLSRLISLAEGRDERLGRLLTTTILVAQLDGEQEQDHFCLRDMSAGNNGRCRECSSLILTYRLLLEHSVYACKLPETVEYDPGRFVQYYPRRQCLASQIDAFDEWHAILDELYRDGRVNMGKFIQEMSFGHDRFELLPLLYSRPDTLLVLFMLRLIRRSYYEMAGHILAHCLQWAITVVKNPERFNWRGEYTKKHPSLSEVLAMYSSTIRFLYSHSKADFFPHISATIDETLRYAENECENFPELYDWVPLATRMPIDALREARDFIRTEVEKLDLQD